MIIKDNLSPFIEGLKRSKLEKFYLGYEWSSTLRDERRKIKQRTIKTK